MQGQSNARIHLALKVANLEKSIDFYQKLFNKAPTKTKPHYAKFEVEHSPLNLALNESPKTKGETKLSHLGIEVQSAEEVKAARARLEAAGLKLRIEDDVTCCYAVQDKVWATDPDGNQWEVFYVKEKDANLYAPKQNAARCCL